MVGHEMKCAIEACTSAEEIDTFYLGQNEDVYRLLQLSQSAYLAHAYPLHSDWGCAQSGLGDLWVAKSGVSWCYKNEQLFAAGIEKEQQRQTKALSRQACSGRVCMVNMGLVCLHVPALSRCCPDPALVLATSIVSAMNVI